jgi:EAL domain-containing protein (putative c-di-GMP-specific phosphodiesterase class I)
VETEGQLNILREANCDLVQGYYFSKPLPPREFEKLIEKELTIERD